MWKLIVGLFIIFGETFIYSVPHTQALLGLAIFIVALALCISGVQDIELKRSKKRKYQWK